MIQSIRLVTAGALGLAVAVAGCQIPGRHGPISQSLATCRQFSRQGIAALERHRWEQAESLLAKAVEACPADVDARRNYAEALWHRGAHTKALAQLEKAVELAGEDTALLVRMAEMQLALGRLDLARTHAEKALDLDSKSAAAWAVHGKAMQAAGDARRALADYHRALAVAPNDQTILLETAELYRQLNQPQRALATLQRLADTYAPGEEPQQVLYLQGLAYLALGRQRDARESLCLANTRGPANPDVLYRLAETELAEGLPDEAVQAAREALALDPNHRPSRDLLARLGALDEPNRPLRR